jgi:glycerate-2-kinase
VYLVGAGKACNAMARAVDGVLGDRLTRGIAIVKVSEETDVFNRTEVYVGGHPLPNEEGHRASRAILDLVDQAGPDDLFIGVVSGGSSALMSCPIEGISLQDEMDATDVLLKSGAGIYEVNAVRRHILRRGGMLAKKIAAVGAELIGFGISDAVGSPPTGDIGIPYARYKSTPFGPDQTTLDDARAVIRNYDLADRLPRSIVEYLDTVGEEGETPKAFPDNTYFLLNTLPDSCRYAKEIAEDRGESRPDLPGGERGRRRAHGGLARETWSRGTTPPVLLLGSGETTTKILDNSVVAMQARPRN